MITKWIIGNKQPTQKDLFLWNVIGSGIYAVASMILTYLTIRIVGPQDGGVFAIGLTLAQMFVYFAYYEMRNFEVTDSQNKYTFADYHAAKLIACIMMVMVSVGYFIIKKYTAYKFVILLLVCIYRMLDGYADVYEAQFHKDGRLDLSGKSMAFRTVLSLLFYFVVLVATRDLVLALLAAIISGMLGVYIFNIAIYRSFSCPTFNWNLKKIGGIFKDCFPLFVGMFLWTYLLSASRIAVDDVMSSEAQSYYQVLFMPVSVINLFAGFLIRPNLIILTEYWDNREQLKFWKVIGKLSVQLLVITIVCMGGAYVCGTQILSFVIGCDLTMYKGLLTFLILAGGLNAFACTLYYVLTIYRSYRSILLGYIIAALVALCISRLLVHAYALQGAAMSYFFSIFVLAIIFMACIICIGRRAYVATK